VGEDRGIPSFPFCGSSFHVAAKIGEKMRLRPTKQQLFLAVVIALMFVVCLGAIVAVAKAVVDVTVA
jgi:hypothetical protein